MRRSTCKCCQTRVKYVGGWGQEEDWRWCCWRAEWTAPPPPSPPPPPLLPLLVVLFQVLVLLWLQNNGFVDKGYIGIYIYIYICIYIYIYIYIHYVYSIYTVHPTLCIQYIYSHYIQYVYSVVYILIYVSYRPSSLCIISSILTMYHIVHPHICII